MTEFKVGDRALVTRKLSACEDDHNCGWLPPMDDMVEKEYIIEEISEHGNYRLGGFYFPPAVLRRVSRSPAARILFEKVMVNGTKCRKITGFEGILQYDELPGKYTEGVPSFDLYKSSASHYEFDGSEMLWKSVDGTSSAVSYNIPRDSDPIVVLGPLPVHVLTLGDIYPEATYRAIFIWLKRAGSRLAKIRREERDAWSGSGADEI